jgi:hypothetical protein
VYADSANDRHKDNGQAMGRKLLPFATYDGMEARLSSQRDLNKDAYYQVVSPLFGALIPVV